MKILLINTYYYHRGGDSTYTLALEKLLTEKGHTVIPFSMKNSNNYPNPYDKYFVSEVDFDKEFRNKNFLKSLKIIKRIFYSKEAREKLKELISKENPDLAHIQNIRNHITPSVIYELKKNKTPIVWTLHDYDLMCPNSTFLSHGKICEKCKINKFYNMVLNRCKKEKFLPSLLAAAEMYFQKITGVFNLVDIFITPSNFLREKLIEYGYDRGKIIHIPNFIDNTDELEAKDDVKDDEYVIYFGRLSPEKGLTTLINAVSKIQNLKLRIVGDGPLRKELEEIVRVNNYKNIIFEGYKNKRDLRTFIKNSSFSIVPSIWYENMPFSVIESFALKKPVIGSRIGGIPEMINEGVNGYMYNPDDENELISLIINLKTDKETIKKMGINGYNFVNKYYSKDQHYSDLIRIYSTHINKVH